MSLAAEFLGSNQRLDDVIRRAADRGADRPCAIFMDEAHVIVDWSADVRESINVTLRDSGHLGVIIASSERRAVEQLLDDGQPLYSTGYVMQLPEIDGSTWASGLEKRFIELGVDVERPTLETLVEHAKHHPYCTMRLASESALQAEYQRKILGETRASITDVVIQAALVVVRNDSVWKSVIE